MSVRWPPVVLAAAGAAAAGALLEGLVGSVAAFVGASLVGAGGAAWLLRAPPPPPTDDPAPALQQRVQQLEAVLDAAPLAVVLCDAEGTVVLANRTARDLFHRGADLTGHDFDAALAACPPGTAEAVKDQANVLITVDQQEGEEAWHVSRPHLDLNMQRHTLYVVKELTRELSRQEVAIWKKVIRVVSHELNNSLAPISSLVHSAKLVLDRPEHTHRLAGMLDTVQERADHLRTFLEGYAQFARLAPPETRPVAWAPFLETLATLYPFRLVGQPPAEGVFDPAQLQQALINLLKNAHEAGGDPDAIELRVATPARGGVQLSVVDAGRGMTEQVMRQALIPFYSTKKNGSGLGLALVREIVEAHDGAVRLEPRPEGGTAVHVWLPAAVGSGSPRVLASGPERRPGRGRGDIHIADDFDDPLPS